MPIIETVTYESVKGGCWLGLRCSSAEKGVDLSWQGEPSSMTVFNMTNPDGNSAVLLAFLNTTQKSVKFNCTSSKNMEKASSVVTRKCEGKVTIDLNEKTWYHEMRYNMMTIKIILNTTIMVFSETHFRCVVVTPMLFQITSLSHLLSPGKEMLLRFSLEAPWEGHWQWLYYIFSEVRGEHHPCRNILFLIIKLHQSFTFVSSSSSL